MVNNYKNDCVQSFWSCLDMSLKLLFCFYCVCVAKGNEKNCLTINNKFLINQKKNLLLFVKCVDVCYKSLRSVKTTFKTKC